MTETSVQLEQTTAPKAPKAIDDLGISLNNLMRLLLKTMYVRALESPAELSGELKLHYAVVNQLLENAKDQKLVEILSSNSLRVRSEFNYSLSGKGREWATEALTTSQYIGPAPITLDEYKTQVHRQRLTNEQVGPDTLRGGMTDLVVPEPLLRRLGPAINSGRPMLLYGTPGNGKTSVAQVIGHIFQDVIYVPYCMEVDGQIIKIFDPVLHIRAEEEQAAPKAPPLRADELDRRWVPCQRPLIITGGELTLESLDIRYNAHSRYYEAPLHVKANGGTFLVDDLGRQLVRPKDLLNRWIIPMENSVDYLTLHTGTTFSVPFDEFLIFSTNLRPSDLMDPAFLRRIPYKVPVEAPDPVAYTKVFKMVCEAEGLTLDADVANFAIEQTVTQHKLPLAFYQPKFIVQQSIASCKYMHRPPALSIDLVADALENLSTKESVTSKLISGDPDGNPAVRSNGGGEDHESEGDRPPN